MWTQLLDLHGNVLMETMLRGVPSPGEWVQFEEVTPEWSKEHLEHPERAPRRKAHARWRVLSVKHTFSLDCHQLIVVLAGDEG